MNKNVFIKFTVAISVALLPVLALDDGIYMIKSMHSGGCLELESLDNNSKLIESKCSEEKDTQKFEFTNIKNNIFTIGNLRIGNKSLDNGAHLYNSSNSDRFAVIEKESNNTYRIKNTRSKKFVTLIPYSNDVIQYNGHASKEQFWKLVGEETDATETIYASCKEILDAGKSNGTGKYIIDVDGDGSNEPFEVTCDMDTDGGGWTVYDFRKYATYNDMANSKELANYSTYDPNSGYTYHPEVSFHQNSAYGLRWGYNTPTYDGDLEHITFNTPKFSEILLKGGLPVYQADWGRLRLYAYDKETKQNWVHIQLNVDKNTCHQWDSGMFWTSSQSSTKNFELEEGLENGCRGIGIKEHYVNSGLVHDTIRLGLGGVHIGSSRQTEAFIDYIKVR